MIRKVLISIAALISSAIAAVSLAQTSGDGVAVLERLRRAEQVLSALHRVGHSWLAEHYGPAKEAVVVFQNFAPQFIVDGVVRDLNDGIGWVAGPAPTSILGAVEYCERHHCVVERKIDIFSRVHLALLRSILHLESLAKYGPVADNPEFYKSMTAPKTGQDLLRNVEFVLNQQAQGREDFYTVENMERFFGVAPQGILQGASARIRGFEARWWVDRERPAEAPRNDKQRCRYEVWGSIPLVPDQLHAGASLGMFCPSSGPTPAEVERMFGDGWRSSPMSRERDGHGSMKMVYHLDGPPIRGMRFEFARDRLYAFQLTYGAPIMPPHQTPVGPLPTSR